MGEKISITMNLSDILTPNAVRVLANVSSKKRLLHDVSDVANACYDFQGTPLIAALMEREALGPTGVGHGVALPHARLDDIDTVKGVFLRLERPVDFGAVDRQPVDLVFALFAPRDSGVSHLKALALVSRTLRDQAVCEKLRANSDPLALYAVLTAQKLSKVA